MRRHGEKNSQAIAAVVDRLTTVSQQVAASSTELAQTAEQFQVLTGHFKVEA